MRRLASFAIALAVGLSCGPYPLQPVKPTVFEMQCYEPLFVGHTYTRRINWQCDVGQEGRRGGNTDGRCVGALTTTAWCPDDRCTTSVRAVPQYNGYYGENVVEVVPTAPGPLETWVELRHEVGMIERHRVIACEALPQPTFTITCTMRDPATGSYLACPAAIPAGAEVHLEATVAVESGTMPLPGVDVTLDGKERRIDSSYGREDVECTRTDDARNPRRRTVRCAIVSATPGDHVFEIAMAPLPPHSQTFTVRTP